MDVVGNIIWKVSIFLGGYQIHLLVSLKSSKKDKHKSLLCVLELKQNYIFKKILSFREGKGGRKRETSIGYWLPLSCAEMGTWPATQACALTGNQTGDLSVCILALNPLNRTSQNHKYMLYILRNDAS